MPSPNPLNTRVPMIGNKLRWQAIDDCAFFLFVEEMISEDEKDKIRERLLRRAKKEGFRIIPVRDL